MRTAWRNALMLALSAAAIVGIAYAQAGPTFEVSQAFAGGRGGNGRVRMSRTPQRIAFQSTHLVDIMAFAYELPPDRIERRPQWMYDDLYNVAVTTAAPAELPEQKLMLQKLLEERFSLVAHRITTASPVYFLAAGAKPTLTPAKDADAAGVPGFGTTLQDNASGVPGPAGVGRHVSMADLAEWLYQWVRVPVLDKTGITGFFDIEIPGLPMRGGAEGTIRAVQDALGLNLEWRQGTAESLIIDRVERPKAN